MTKEKAKYLAEIFNAYEEGKPIEVFLDGEWCEITSNGFNFDVENDSYQIKKEPKYRPFRSAKECFEEMKKHQPFGWLCWNKVFIPITKIRPENIEIDGEFYHFDEVLDKKVTFADGQPFGIKD